MENSVICSTYNLSYGAATELLSLDLKEETELSILYQAAALRNKWRVSNVRMGEFCVMTVLLSHIVSI